jgi:hypothetical protein
MTPAQLDHLRANYRDLAFLYLRDAWREKEIHRFITKVEEVHAISEEFIHQQDQ